MAYSCPDCGAELSVSPAPGSRVLVCTSCRGRLYGLSPFERLLADGVGSRVWAATAAGEPAGPCPYCSKPMHRPDPGSYGAHDAATGLAVCRMCQEVWVPAAAAQWMAAHGPVGAGGAPEGGGAASSGAAPTECANCGAPYTPDEEGRCHWCRAQIGPPAPLVVFLAPEREPLRSFRLI